ncbi:MAG: tetratricopeptide repeat protein [Pseudomonadales bacterium]
MKFGMRIMLLSLLLSGCSMLPGEAALEPDKTLADLEPVEPPTIDRSLPEKTAAEVMQSYLELLSVVEDPDVKAAAKARLGGLMMLDNENKQFGASATDEAKLEHYYTDVIKLYEELLAEFPERAGNDRLLYQLSKAYDLDGRSDESNVVLETLVSQYPNSEYAVEAFFRRGETLFSNSDYRGAQAAYERAIGFGEQTPYYDNALYMLGWTQFKRNRYEDALPSFLQALDRTLPAGAPLKQLAKTQRELIEDALRVVAIIFSYLDGPQSIQQLIAEQGRRHYEPLLYQRLGELYLSKKRYKDTADTYKTFVATYSSSDVAPRYHVKQIEAYEKGNFPTEIMPAKESFVVSYGITSEYWKAKGPEVRAEIEPHLHQYLDELAKNSHATAQQQNKLWQAAKDERARKKLNFAQADIQQGFRTAGRWYQEFIDTFPLDKKVEEIWFLLAESQYEAEDYAAAIKSYEYIAYEFQGEKNRTEAGYAALLAYDKNIDRVPEAEKDAIQKRKINSAARFGTTFPNDSRAPTVLARAAEDLLADKQYELAQQNATKLVNWGTPISKTLELGGWLVLAHAEFELQQYRAAEQAYTRVYALLPEKDKRRKEINENLAASVYKQAESLLAEGNTSASVDQFLRVAQIAPGSTVQVNAEFDAATHLLSLKQWPRAITVLKRFRSNYPDHELSQQVPAKLVLAYQENEQWRAAADELNYMLANNIDPENKRDATYLAAELYEKSGDERRAIRQYDRYVNQFPEPFDERIEAMHKITELHTALNQTSEKRRWLRKIINADARAGAARNDRSKHLAAQASMLFADEARDQFNAVSLKLPLKTSLKKKKKVLKKALQAYTKTADYGVQEFATQANYNIGEIYTRLSQDLMRSQRPKKLSALEQEQYEVLLEEQAYPFEEEAIEIHETNAQRSWSGVYDSWVKASFRSLGKLVPGRYNKLERKRAYSDAIQ